MDSPTFVGVVEVDDSFFISCKNGSVYEIASLEASVLPHCVASKDGSVSVPPQTADIVKLKRVFQTKSFANVNSVALTPQGFIEANDKQLGFGDHSKVTVPDHFEGVKKILDLNEVM